MFLYFVSQVDLTVKVLTERLSERQRGYAKAAEQLHKTTELTTSLKRLRFTITETEEMLRQLNERLPSQSRLPTMKFIEDVPIIQASPPT